MKLQVQERDTQLRVKALRKENKIPGIIYGRHMDAALPILFDRISLVKAIQVAGRSTAVELHGEGIDALVLFHTIQYHPVTDAVIHIDCLAVNKNEKTTAEVPVHLVGESSFEKDGLGQIQLIRNRLEVEALPLDLPHHIEIDISSLTEPGQVVHISDVTVDDKVELVGDPELAVVSAVLFKEEEPEPTEEELLAAEGLEGEEGEEGEGSEESEGEEGSDGEETDA